MHKEFPLSDVTIVRSGSVSNVSKPVYLSDGLQVSQDEFFMMVAGVGAFYARGGKVVEYYPEAEADEGWVRLFLDGQVLVALLHQRKVIAFHASSVVSNGHGVMILGESGAGKSSLAAAFALKGARLLTDDITPVIFRKSIPFVWPLHGEIRIRRNTAEQLKVNDERLREAEAGTGKQYLQVGSSGGEKFPLHVILKIEIGDVLKPEFDEPLQAEKFSFLRSEICMSEILAGMPETEAEYLHQLLEIIKQVKIIRVVRPTEIRIADLHSAIEAFLTTEDAEF